MMEDMMDELNGGGCGDCSSCGGSCGDCGGGCGGGNVDLSHPTVTLTLNDDTDVTCAVINIFPAGDKHYIALLPLDENGQNTDGEVYLYRYYEDEYGNPNLDNIESDEEYEIAADAFDEILDEAQFRATEEKN